MLQLVSIESMMPSNHLILCHPLLLPSIFPSIRVFSNEPALCVRWPKYWRFSISPFNEYLGLISFRIDWFDLLTVQETLKSLLQHYNSKIQGVRGWGRQRGPFPPGPLVSHFEEGHSSAAHARSHSSPSPCLIVKCPKWLKLSPGLGLVPAPVGHCTGWRPPAHPGFPKAQIGRAHV